MYVAEVYLPFSSEPLYYLLPQEKKSPPSWIRVLIPYRNQEQLGLLKKVFFQEKKDPHLKPILIIIDKEPILTEEQFLLAKKLQKIYFFLPLGEILFSMLPSGKRATSSPPYKEEGNLEENLPLREEQKRVIQKILSSSKEEISIHLLWGITGSGKTRVYIELIRKYLEHNLGVILLEPEIPLSYSIDYRLKPIFQEKLALLHSGLSRGVYLKEYKRLLHGEAKVLVGTRSSLFAPIRDLGLVIFDEEHDPSYKEEKGFFYSSKRVAYMRLEVEKERKGVSSLGRVLLLGSATPLVEEFYYAKKGVYHLHTLKERATGFSIPKVYLIKHLPQQGLFSSFLKKKMEEHLQKGSQILLLLNRRGYSLYAFCPRCEKSLSCRHCSSSLHYHREGKLKCHLCSYEERYIGMCPTCGEKLKLVGRGTQRVEEEIEKNFPGVSYARLDRDSALLSGYVEDVLEGLKKRKIQILIGTQMVSKGLDVFHLNLVGILDADLGLTLPDFRASERVFALLLQTAGRAGRHNEGEVIIQTQQKSHYAMQAALKQDYLYFYEKEILFRKVAGFPPFQKIVRIVFSSYDEPLLKKCTFEVKNFLAREKNPLFQEEKVFPKDVWGPVEPLFYKIQDLYRMHLILRDPSLQKLIEFSKRLYQFFSSWKKKGIHLNIDIEPISLL